MRFQSLRVRVPGNVVGFFAGAVCLAGLSGCAGPEFRLSDSDVDKIVSGVSESLTMTTCQGGGGNPKDTTIEIVFVNKGTDEDPVWCPDSQAADCPQVYNNKFLSWQSVEVKDDGTKVDAETRYKIIFSPFKKDVKTANPQGKVAPEKLDDDPPAGLYKYTVIPETMTANCTALDPHFWVN
jgi:hypothetical protein